MAFKFGSLCQGSDRNYLCFLQLIMPENHFAPVVLVSAHNARTHQAPSASSWFQFVPKNVKKHEAHTDNYFGPRVLNKHEAPTDACSPKSAPSRLQVSNQSGPPSRSLSRPPSAVSESAPDRNSSTHHAHGSCQKSCRSFLSRRDVNVLNVVSCLSCRSVLSCRSFAIQEIGPAQLRAKTVR